MKKLTLHLIVIGLLFNSNATQTITLKQFMFIQAGVGIASTLASIAITRYQAEQFHTKIDQELNKVKISIGSSNKDHNSSLNAYGKEQTKKEIVTKDVRNIDVEGMTGLAIGLNVLSFSITTTLSYIENRYLGNKILSLKESILIASYPFLLCSLINAMNMNQASKLKKFKFTDKAQTIFNSVKENKESHESTETKCKEKINQLQREYENDRARVARDLENNQDALYYNGTAIDHYAPYTERYERDKKRYERDLEKCNPNNTYDTYLKEYNRWTTPDTTSDQIPTVEL